MVRDWVDVSDWPLVVVRAPERITRRELVAHFDRIERLVETGEPFVAVVDLDSLRDQTVAMRAYAAARIARFAPRARRTIVAVGHVADHWLSRAVLTTVYWMTPAPFRVRDFRRRDDAVAWARARLDEHLARRERQARDVVAFEAAEV